MQIHKLISNTKSKKEEKEYIQNQIQEDIKSEYGYDEE